MTDFLNTVCLVVAFGCATAGLRNIFECRKKPTRKKLLVLFFLFVFFLLLSTKNWRDYPDTATRASAGSDTAGTIKASIEYDPDCTLAKARQAYKRGEYLWATTLLASLGPADRQKPEVRSLWTEATRLESSQFEAARREGRDSVAHSFQYSLLEAGFDATVTSQGHDSRTLYIEIRKMSGHLVYRLMHPKAAKNANLAEEHIWRFLTNGNTAPYYCWRNMGFRRVILTDGRNQRWEYGLN